MRLSKKEDWDFKYNAQVYRQECNNIEYYFNSLLKKIFGRKAREYMRSYDDYLLWDVLYPKYMPRTNNTKVLEIGSAPGDYLARLHRTFGFIPFGVEYSEKGAAMNKQKFIENGINPDNVMCADFFSDKFHEEYRGFFDIVVSRGFIEHFTDIDEVITKHLNLLADDGYLFVSIPNYRGINYILQWLFSRKILTLHNLGIMDKKIFTKLFEQENLNLLHSDYWGTFNFGLFNGRDNSISNFIQHKCEYLQLLLNIVFRILFKDKELKSRFSSPHLIFIGQKKQSASH